VRILRRTGRDDAACRGIVGGVHTSPFDWCRILTMRDHFQFDHCSGSGEERRQARRLDVAFHDHIRMRTRMNKRCIRGQRSIDVGHMRRRFNFELDAFSRILGLGDGWRYTAATGSPTKRTNSLARIGWAIAW
jgi:hypothetical protein